MGWESPSWDKIPKMEGFFFEISHALSIATMAIGTNGLSLAIRQMKRFEVLLKPSGIFDELDPSNKILYGKSAVYLEKVILSRCDNIIRSLEKAKSDKKLDSGKVLTDLSSLIFSLNMQYMYAKTKVCFAGSYKPAFDVYEKEGIE